MSIEHGKDPWLPRGTEWPLLFSYRMPFSYQGITVRIELSGRATAYLDPKDGSVRIDGVNPGAFTASGDNLKMAEDDLRKTLTGVFLDMATDSTHFAQFENHVKDFLNSTDDDTLAEWETALARVRKSVGIGVSDLPRRSADENPPGVAIIHESEESSDAPLSLTERPRPVVLASAA